MPDSSPFSPGGQGGYYRTREPSPYRPGSPGEDGVFGRITTSSLTNGPIQEQPGLRKSTIVNTVVIDEVDQRTPEFIAKTCGWNPDHQTHDDLQPNLLTVVSSLGNGSIGVVEEVRISPQFATFVRKRVQLPYHSRKQRLQIIKEEAAALKSLQHDHIVKSIGSYEEGQPLGRQFYSLLMWPVGDQDLKTYLEMNGDTTSNVVHNRADRKDVVRLLQKWFKCLASALDYMHEAGMRHQDIKPSNIICRREEIYFTDFSSSARFEVGQTTSTENPARTSAMYAAPEVVSMNGFTLKHGRGTDVFALGAVFCEMLAVTLGSSVHNFHEFLLAHTKLETNAGGILLYGRKTERIEQYFREDAFYLGCIRDMLALNRDRRPNARTVAATIRSSIHYKLDPCSCDPIISDTGNKNSVGLSDRAAQRTLPTYDILDRRRPIKAAPKDLRRWSGYATRLKNTDYLSGRPTREA
jgi:serine/threonine protein kinase